MLAGQAGQRVAGADFEAAGDAARRAGCARPSAKRTVWRRWRAQYAGSVACSAVIQVPVTLEMKGMSRRLRGATPATRVGERRQDRVHHRRVEGVRGVQAAAVDAAPRSARLASASIGRRRAGDHAAAGAVDRGEGQARRRAAARSSASGSGTASMAPGGSACISRPRAATSASASSREKTPARQAATYSPTLWPSMRCGLHAPRHPQPGQRVLDDEQRGWRRAQVCVQPLRACTRCVRSAG